MSSLRFTRRALLGAAGLGATTGCLLPERPPPQIRLGKPVGPIARPRGEGLLIGAARIDLTPPKGLPIWLAGFGFQRRMREVRDPISAQCIVFDDGSRRVALVVADLIGLMRPSIERVRQMVGSEIGVVVASTHNHASPDTIGFWGPAILYAVPHRSGLDPSYLAGVEQRLAQVVKKAAVRARPAELRVGTSRLPAGVAKNIRPPFVAPDDLLVLQAVDAGDGTTIATLVNFACHAETQGPNAHRLTADFPGALRARVEDLVGGVSIFANGSLGGMIVPDVDDGADVLERSRAIDRVGSLAADAVKEALAAARPIPARPVRLRQAIVDVPTTNDLFAMIERIGLVEPRPRGKAGLITEVGRLDVGGLSFALLPGEPTPLIGARAQQILLASGAEQAAVIGLASDELGYLLDPEAQFDNPEFDYEASMSPGRGAAPVLLEALRNLPGD